MIQALPERMSFEEFLEWYPENGRRYELHNGIVIEMQPTGPHELIGGFLVEELTIEIRRQKLPYSIPRTCLLKPHLPDSGYQPDVVVLNRTLLSDEPLWEKASTTVCQLIEGEYQMQRFIAGQCLESSIFPKLELTTDAIFQAAQL